MSDDESSREKYQPTISQDLATRKVHDFMTQKVITASSSTTVKTAMQLMIQHEVSGLPIVDHNGRCIGIYSELDALLQGASGPIDVPIRFTTKVLSVLESSHYKEALILMAKNKIKRLPVTDPRGTLIGVISRQDLLKALFADNDRPKG